MGHAQLDDFFAVPAEHSRVPARPHDDVPNEIRPGLRLALPDVNGDASGLRFDERSGNLGNKFGGRRCALIEQSPLARIELERHIDLSTVTANEVNPVGHRRYGAQVVQRPAGDHGHGGVGQVPQHLQSLDRFGYRSCGIRIGHDVRDGAVVVDADQQMSRRGELLQRDARLITIVFHRCMSAGNAGA